ncbi:MAG: hypothetical protein RPT25_05180 [Cycloclasticus sp.]|jgi:hypothetical protein
MFAFIGGAISAVSGALGAVASAIGAVVSTGRVMLDAISRGLPMVEKICDIALTVGKGLGLFSPNHGECDMYELGMRAERSVSEGVTSEQFDSNQAFIDHLRDKGALSKENIEQLSNLSDGDKLKYACIGSAVTISAITEQYQVDIPETFWLAGADLGVGPEQFKPMLDIFESAQLKPDLEGFLKGELASELQRSIYELIDEKLGDVLNNETLDKLLG